jgi:hypothetical protein
MLLCGAGIWYLRDKNFLRGSDGEINRLTR